MENCSKCTSYMETDLSHGYSRVCVRCGYRRDLLIFQTKTNEVENVFFPMKLVVNTFNTNEVKSNEVGK